MLRKLQEFLKHLNLLSLSVPVLILISSAALPLLPIIRHMFVAIILVWLGLEAMMGFPFWKG